MSVDDTSQIWNAILDMYDAYLAGDRARSNSHIAEDVTLWDTEHEPLVSTLAGLDALRDSRPDPGDGPKVVGVHAKDPVIDVWGDVALARHTFTVEFDSPSVPVERVRNTSVWRRRDGRWLVVHNHEDVLPARPVS